MCNCACSIAGAARGDLPVPGSDLSAAGAHDGRGTHRGLRPCAPAYTCAYSSLL